MTEVACEQTDEEQTGQLSIAQMVQHCNANAEAMSSNTVEVSFFYYYFFLICNCLNCNYHCDPTIINYIHLKFVFPQFTSSSNKKKK